MLSARQRAIIGVEALLRAELDDGSTAGAPWLFHRALVEGRVADLERRAGAPITFCSSTWVRH